MAKKIQMWGELGPRLAPTKAVEPEDVIETLVATTNQTRGSILAVLAELDVVLENGLKNGQIVKLPNGTTFRPVGKKDGTIDIKVRFSSRLSKAINSGKRAEWVNAGNIGKSEEEMIALWNEAHPDDLIE